MAAFISVCLTRLRETDISCVSVKYELLIRMSVLLFRRADPRGAGAVLGSSGAAAESGGRRRLLSDERRVRGRAVAV